MKNNTAKSMGKRGRFRQELIKLDIKLQELMIIKTEHKKTSIQLLSLKREISLLNDQSNLNEFKELSNHIKECATAIQLMIKKMRVAKLKFDKQKSLVESLRQKL